MIKKVVKMVGHDTRFLLLCSTIAVLTIFSLVNSEKAGAADNNVTDSLIVEAETENASVDVDTMVLNEVFDAPDVPELETIDSFYVMLTEDNQSTEVIEDTNTEKSESETEPETETETVVEEITTEATTEAPHFWDVYSSDEVWLLKVVVEAEIGGYSFENKCDVASVIFNRLNTEGQFGDTLSEVLNAGQFVCIANGAIYNVSVDQTTIDAIDYVFQNGDTTGGALFFNTKGKDSWAHNNRTFLFCDGPHDFYK